MATRCCCPADNVDIARLRRSAKTEQVERFLDPAPHDLRRKPEPFHPERQFVFDHIGDERCLRVLTDDADDVGQISGPVAAGVAPGDEYPAGQRPAGEMRNQAVH